MTRLVADIGGTHARFGLAAGDAIEDVRVLSCDAYESPADAALAYLATARLKPQDAAFAIAGALDGGDKVEMTNHSWAFSIEDTRKALNLQSLRVVNDFAAISCAVPYLAEKDRTQVGSGTPQKDMPIGVIGPGTGLGVGGIIFAEGKAVPVATEGGHMTMPASTPRDFALFEYLKKEKYSHISAERVISGKGLVNIYEAICSVDNIDLPEKPPHEITAAALDGSCRVSAEALSLMCHYLGVAAGNLALSYGAFGGIYIAGGIVPKLGEYFAASPFRESFVAKGRYREYLSRIPTFVITHPWSALEGLRRLG